MRLFISILIDDIIQARVSAVQQALKLRLADQPIRWVEPENLHITLQFLGEQNPDRLSVIQTAMQESAQAHSPFEISLGGLGAFPNWRRSLVLWLGVETGEEHLGRLAHDLETALAPNLAEREPRKFHAHVTLARFKTPVQDLNNMVSQEPTQNLGHLSIKSFSLMQSQRNTDALQYLELKRVNF